MVPTRAYSKAGTVRSVCNVPCRITQRYIRKPCKKLEKILKAAKTCLEYLDESACWWRWVVCVNGVVVCRLWVKHNVINAFQTARGFQKEDATVLWYVIKPTRG